MTEEAIQQDVSTGDQVADQTTDTSIDSAATPEAPAAEPSHLSERDRKMAAIAEKRKAEREEGRKAAALMADPELTDEEYDQQLAARNDPALRESPEDDQLDPEGEASQEPGEADRSLAENGEADDSSAAEEQPATRKIKVNGQIRELTEEEYERHLAKDLAGDQKLQLAAAQERKLAERAAELDRREAALREPSPPPGADAPDVDAAIDEYVDAIYGGDPDAAKAKLKEAISVGRQSSTPNIEELVSAAATRAQENMAVQRRNENAQEGWDQFARDYADIAENDEKIAAADVLLKKVLAESPDMSPKEAILEAGRRARELFPVVGQEPAPERPEPNLTDADRKDRKAKLTRVPSSGQPSQKREEPKVDMSTAAKIARLRQSRAV